MKKIFTIALWEYRKILSNWKKAVVVFLLPAVIMMFALNLFPMVLNYLETGTFGNHTIMVIDAPPSFSNYLNDLAGNTVYDFEFLSSGEYSRLSPEQIREQFRKGIITLTFEKGPHGEDFDSCVRNYFEELTNGSSDAISQAEVTVSFNKNSPVMDGKAQQFAETIMDPYIDKLPDYIDGDFTDLTTTVFTADEFNPIGKVLDNRSVANRGASRVIPGMIILLMYYCTYSLVSDVFVSEKERGFYNKLVLTPVPRNSIFAGKLLMILVVVLGSSLITFFMMFMSSWLNHSNDAMSLLPFGMFLTPTQLLLIIIEMIPAAVLMGVLAMNITFNSHKMQDSITFLQFPLVLFLFEFFIQMFRGTRPLTLEMFVPLHNTLQIMRDIFVSEDHWWRAVIPIIINTILAVHVYRKTLRKELSR